MAKTVIVSCGTGIATSTVAAKAIEEACKEAGIDVITKQCKAAEIPILIEQGADLIVTTSQMRFDPGIPVVKGLAFLTGVGKDEVVQEILDHLRD
ncbi:MAG: PTS sugar transporter subunit IIB [Anaerolineales bacterium]|jgi:PTS system galactitol-specific IIB component|nr:PTS sugar transporter subunit IIB [Anaerolineales bacterium]